MAEQQGKPGPRVQLSPKALELVDRLDGEINKRAGYAANNLARFLDDLVTFGRVEVGRRATCGKPDPTQFIYAGWVRVLKRLRADGIVISEEPVKHKNQWATKAGGFWDSSIYSLSGPLAKAEGGPQ